MKKWNERTPEEANLFNPAFCGLILSATCRGYQEKATDGLPFPLIFMVLPIILHKGTRELLPKKSNALMSGWLQDNTSVRISFYERLLSLKSHTTEGLFWASKEAWIDLSKGSRIFWAGQNKILSKANKILDGEAIECIQCSQFLGKWLASNGTESSLLSMWGIIP